MNKYEALGFRVLLDNVQFSAVELNSVFGYAGGIYTKISNTSGRVFKLTAQYEGTVQLGRTVEFNDSMIVSALGEMDATEDYRELMFRELPVGATFNVGGDWVMYRKCDSAHAQADGLPSLVPFMPKKKVRVQLQKPTLPTVTFGSIDIGSEFSTDGGHKWRKKTDAFGGFNSEYGYVTIPKGTRVVVRYTAQPVGTSARLETLRETTRAALAELKVKYLAEIESLANEAKRKQNTSLLETGFEEIKRGYVSKKAETLGAFRSGANAIIDRLIKDMDE